MNDEQDWIIVCAQAGERDKYLSYDEGYPSWASSLKYSTTKFFSTATQAQAALDLILQENPVKMMDGSINAPTSLRNAAGLCNTKTAAILILSIHQLVIADPQSVIRIQVQDKKPTGYTYE